MFDFTDQKNIKMEIDGVPLKFTNLDKVFWPEEGYTKGDLLNFYAKMAPTLIPYLWGRPESLLRFPNGVFGKRFYQKNIITIQKDWMETVDIPSENDQGMTRYLICNNLATLLYIINLGCIDLNPWNSRVEKLDYPDYLLIDLDPLEIDFSYVIKTAKAVKKVLDRLDIVGFPKTSGATGMHIYIPTGAKYTYEQIRQFAEIIVNLVHKEVPEFTSVERSTQKRIGKVYLDFLQNAEGQTLATPYCVRPKPKVPVSTPLSWDEVEKEGFRPENFNIANIFSRLERVGDLFAPLLTQPGVDINQTLKNVSE